MARPCDDVLTLEKKLVCFLSMSLRAYKVPEEEIHRVLAFMTELDYRAVAQQVMHQLFNALAMRFEFTLVNTGKTPHTQWACGVLLYLRREHGNLSTHRSRIGP